MSNSNPSHSRPPKTMSSRLMTMKFMQRAAASAPSTTLQTNSQATEEPPSKRQKTSNGPNTSTTLTSESHLPHPVIDEEGLKRERAIESLGEEAGETKWVLNIVDGFLNEREPSLRTITASYSEIDEESWRPAIVGRRKFGKFNQEKENRQNNTADETLSSSEDATEAEDGDHQSGAGSDDIADGVTLRQSSKEKTNSRANAERLEKQQQRKAKRIERARLAEKRRKKEVKLNKLSAISGSGGGSAKKGDRECYQCHEKGHEARECPQRGQRKHEKRMKRTSKQSESLLDY